MSTLVITCDDVAPNVRRGSTSRASPLASARPPLGLLPWLVLALRGTGIGRSLAVVMIGGLVSSTLFTLLALPTFYLESHRASARWRRPRGEA